MAGGRSRWSDHDFQLHQAQKAPRRKPIQHERIQQQQGRDLLASLGAKPYVLGTTRAKKCWKCGEMTRDWGTRQTKGISDVFVVLPKPRHPPIHPRGRLLWWEGKKPGFSPSDVEKEQYEFRELVLEAGGEHVLGTLKDLCGFLIDGGWVRSDDVAHYKRPDALPV